MFELPNAKRVRRDELDDASSVEELSGDEEHQAELARMLSAKLAETIEWEIFPVPERPCHEDLNRKAAAGSAGDMEADEVGGEEEPPEEFEFRLFSSEKAGVKVVLEKDRPFKPGEGGIVAKRPASYYLARPATAEERRRYEAVAVTGEQIVERSQQRWWGRELPWKTVARLTITPKATKHTEVDKVVAESADEPRRRKRPGKKTRIARRKKDRTMKAKQEVEEMAKMTREEHLKAKKKRLNHAKKLRARAKAKEKKLLGHGGDVGSVQTDENEVTSELQGAVS